VQGSEVRRVLSRMNRLEDPLGAAADCEQVLANGHFALARNYQLMTYVSGLSGVTRGRTHAFRHWLGTLDATPFLFPGLVAGGVAPDRGTFPCRTPRPVPIWGCRGDPAMPRDASTPLEAHYTDNDS
jgi:hypothetical protein